MSETDLTIEQEDTPGTLIVVDDNEADRILLSHFLMESGHTVLTAESGQRALELIKQHDFDLVLLDSIMPELSGTDVLKALRETYSVMELPVIMVTGMDRSKDITEVLYLGANDFVVKPVDEYLILSRVKAHLSHKRAREAIIKQAEELSRDNELLQMVQDKLEERVEERTASLQQEMQERTQTEQILLQSARLVALGQMAAGMAHELHQPLAVISATAEGLQLRLEHHKEVTREGQLKWSQDILRQVERMRRIIEHLRLFSRDRTDAPREQVGINEVVHAALGMIGAQLESHGVQVRLELAEDLQAVTGDPFRLEQVLLNLLTNAQDALDEKEIQLEDEKGLVWEKAVYIRTRSHAVENQVVVEVEDRGNGICKKDQQRLFEPFFTTKEPDKGTGLGLSLSYAIVKDHAGELECQSREGEGTLFRVRLPVAACTELQREL